MCKKIASVNSACHVRRVERCLTSFAWVQANHQRGIGWVEMHDEMAHAALRMQSTRSTDFGLDSVEMSP